MNPFRCSNCDKLLGMIEGKAEIKCSKCKTMNSFNWQEQQDYGDSIVTLTVMQKAFEVIKDIAHEKIDADAWEDKFKVEY